MPELQRSQLAATPGRHHAYVQRTELAAGEQWATCPLGGTWRAIRPTEQAAWSAGEAHRLAHVKGWPVQGELPPAAGQGAGAREVRKARHNLSRRPRL